MKELTYFYLKSCPYCILASQYLAELQKENPAYAAIPIKMIEERENKALADSFDYFYVPCFYIDGKKVAEGSLDKRGVRQILDMALESD